MNRREYMALLGGTMLMSNGFVASTAFAQDGEVDTSNVVEMALGDENAPVTFIEYASFTCPHCARFHQSQFKDLKADFIDTGKVRFIHRDVYFDKFGLWASMVARCGGQDRFFGITDMIYEEQRDWIGDGTDAGVADRLRTIGKKAGLTPDELDACLSDRDHAQALVAVYQENSATDQVTSTPTLIIDGKKYQNMAYPELKEIIEGKLN